MKGRQIANRKKIIKTKNNAAKKIQKIKNKQREIQLKMILKFDETIIDLEEKKNEIHDIIINYPYDNIITKIKIIMDNFNKNKKVPIYAKRVLSDELTELFNYDLDTNKLSIVDLYIMKDRHEISIEVLQKRVKEKIKLLKTDPPDLFNTAQIEWFIEILTKLVEKIDSNRSKPLIFPSKIQTEIGTLQELPYLWTPKEGSVGRWIKETEQERDDRKRCHG